MASSPLAINQSLRRRRERLGSRLRELELLHRAGDIGSTVSASAPAFDAEDVDTCPPRKGCATIRYMSSQSIRIGQQTLATLRARSKRRGEPLSRLAERYIEEGLRSDTHPHIVFRDGPAGRRAGLISGPDVWEIIAALRTVPEKGEARVVTLAERLGLSEARVRAGIRYYTEYPSEIDDWIAANDAEGGKLDEVLQRERALLG